MKLAIDVDDVLAAFVDHLCTHYECEKGEKFDYWSKEDMTKKYGENWYEKIIPLKEEFWDTLPILSDPKDIDFEIAYYISAFHDSLYESRVNWLKKHGFPDAPLICSKDKLKTCLELGVDVLIDDKPDTIKALEGSKVKGIHFLTHYASFGPASKNYVTNLNQVKQLI